MRDGLARLLFGARALHAIQRARRFSPRHALVSIVTYHHVAEEDPSYAYDPTVADASPVQFRRQIELLARYGTAIGIDELVRAIDGAPLPKNAFMITFDDGYRSCHDVALPILREVGMRATFFIATRFVADRRLYWWERIAIALRSATVARATLATPKPVVIDTRDPRSLGVLTDLVKDTPKLDVERFLDDLCARLGVEWDATIEARHADNLVMSWPHVRALADAGMDIESHGRTHRVLQTLDDATLRDELAGSRADLEAQLGRPVRAIAYPVGRSIAQHARLRDAVAAAGYRIGMSNASGATRVWPTMLRRMLPVDPFDVRRLSTDRAMSDAMFFMQVVVPRFAYIGRGHDQPDGAA
jgi:peptidoglycan/xylan/chitin deacetylase (PgdA/CDA1 family)